MLTVIIFNASMQLIREIMYDATMPGLSGREAAGPIKQVIE
jgi:hypothetical protein